MRRWLAVILVWAALASADAGPRVGVSAPRPRLAVVVVVDGLSWSRLDSLRPWFTSGLKRLLDEGAVATACRYDHLNTETGPGHASIATGAPPRVHGIPLNQWYVPSPLGTGMAMIYSATQPLSGEAENSPKTIPGPGRLRVPTLGDRLVARDPRSKLVAISGKDRSAVFLAGRDRRHAAYWYGSKDGTFVTSAAYDAVSPTGAAVGQVVARFNADKGGDKLAARFGTTWSRLPVPDPAPTPGFETGLGARQDALVGAEFPHALAAATSRYLTALQYSPFEDRLLVDLALDLLADDTLALGRDDVADLLQVAFSANDNVAHHYGPDSVEGLEVLRALDFEIGRLLDGLDARVGKDRVVLALSADHGFLPLASAVRVADTEIVDELNATIDAELLRKDAPRLVHRLDSCSLYLDRSQFARQGAPGAKRVLAIVRRELETTWKKVVLRTFVVHGSFRGRRKDDLARQAWNDRVVGRAGDLYVVLRPGVLIDPYKGKGTSHGTPWDYDTHVPLIFWGGGIVPRRFNAPCAPYDLAPTLASRLGITLPDATGTALRF